jgi:large subunit ribosomal protein L20
MARVKSTASRKHRKILKSVKGFTQARRRRIQTAKEAVLHAGQYAYVGRKLKKRDLRRLWNIRINAASRESGVSYSQLISKLKKAKIEIDRKILSQIIINDAPTFKKIVESLKK